LPWEQVRESVEVKLIEQAGELYILSRSAGQVHKECSMRRRLKRLCREGSYLLRSNLTRASPALLWQYYIQLAEIEQAF
jgi:hypothetical protein